MDFVSNRRLLTRKRTLKFLDDLQTTDGRDGALTIYLKAGSDVTSLQKILRPLTGDVELPDLSRTVSSSTTGAVVFWTADIKCLLIPPFPLNVEHVADGIDALPLHDLLAKDLRLGLVIVRLGEYAIGVFVGEERLTSKVGTGLVHSRHRQGGSSAHRFERHREKQIESFFERVCVHVREQIEPHGKNIDYVVFGGERYTVLAFRGQCHFLKHFDNVVLPRLIDVRKPRQDSLESAILTVWSSTVVQWSEPTS
ncbi:MAG: Vms1/Ankzf1 family peptidyl-tRNA hydrolase [Dehalococcoidia bacterium]|nr:Vms1/Ankzf1 family peptidyl-tRNA hydrolase [Dehalococcoidia bacterium]